MAVGEGVFGSKKKRKRSFLIFQSCTSGGIPGTGVDKFWRSDVKTKNEFFSYNSWKPNLV